MPLNPSQKLNEPRAGAPMRANDAAHVIAAMKRMIVQGVGISVQWLGDQCLISAHGGAVGGFSSGGNQVQVDYVAASKALLEEYTDVVPYARGRVIAGADKGVSYIRNVDNDGWVAINRLE